MGKAAVEMINSEDDDKVDLKREEAREAKNKKKSKNKKPKKKKKKKTNKKSGKELDLESGEFMSGSSADEFDSSSSPRSSSEDVDASLVVTGKKTKAKQSKAASRKSRFKEKGARLKKDRRGIRDEREGFRLCCGYFLSGVGIIVGFILFVVNIAVYVEHQSLWDSLNAGKISSSCNDQFAQCIHFSLKGLNIECTKSHQALAGYIGTCFCSALCFTDLSVML